MEIIKELFYIARNKKILKRAIRIALIVGTLLALINHFDKIITGKFSLGAFLQILLTYTVPFFVSLTSAVLQKREHMREGALRK